MTSSRRASTPITIRGRNEATELMVRALRDQAAYEAPLIDENNAFLLAASVFPYFYSLVGERNPKLPPATGTEVSLFAAGL